MVRTQATKTRALSTLSVTERAHLLDQLIRGRPELTAEVERLAEQTLHTQQDRETVALDVATALQALSLGDLSERAGQQWGGGYVEPHEAAYDILTETLQPFLDDLARRAHLDANTAATEIGYGTLLGLSTCRGCRNDNLLLGQVALPDTVDELAYLVVGTMTQAGLAVDPTWMAEQCPEWVHLVQPA